MCIYLSMKKTRITLLCVPALCTVVSLFLQKNPCCETVCAIITELHLTKWNKSAVYRSNRVFFNQILIYCNICQDATVVPKYLAQQHPSVTLCWSTSSLIIPYPKKGSEPPIQHPLRVRNTNEFFTVTDGNT